MWFKNLRLYRVTRPLEIDDGGFIAALEEGRSGPIGSLEMGRVGWVAPFDRSMDGHLAHIVGGYRLLCMRREEKILPSGVVREFLDDKVAAIEEGQGRKVGRKEKGELKDQVIFELLPRAFSRTSICYGYLTPDGWLIINTTSNKVAEEFVTLLRRSLGSLPVAPPQLKEAPVSVMTRWIESHELPDDFILGNECELQEPGDEGGIVRCRRQELTADEVRAHLEAGKQVVKLAIGWGERVSGVVDETLTVRKLSFGDDLLEQADDIDDDAARFDADFVLMSGELERYITWLTGLFGGENEAAYASLMSNSVQDTA